MHADILIFAVIAAFLIYRLNSVLGTKHGDERSRPNPFTGQPAPSTVQNKQALAPAAPTVVNLRPAAPANIDQYIDADANKDGRVSTGLDEIAKADSGFEVGGFMQGARYAFEAVVMAFAKGELDALKPLLSPKLYKDFAAGVKARDEANRMAETIIHRIKSSRVTEAHLGGVMAYVTVAFDVEETVFSRDRTTGAVVEGDQNRIIDIQDVWTFSRDIRSTDPNWILIETGAVEK